MNDISSTQKRPEGQRVINDTLVKLDTKKHIDDLKNEAVWDEKKHNSVTLFKSDKMRIVLIGMQAGFRLKEHTAPAVISVHVLDGKMNFVVENNVVELHKGQLCTLQAKVPHAVEAIEETFFLLTLALI